MRKLALVLHSLPRSFVYLWQSYLLDSLIKTALTSVPFYKNLYAKHGMERKRFYTLADLKKLPIIDKRILATEPLITRLNSKVPEKFYYMTRTSGTTGEPFTVVQGAYRAKLMYTFPFLTWKKLASEISNIRGAALRVNNRPVTREFLHLPVKDLRDRPDDLLKKLTAFKPDYLDGRATGLAELARLVVSRNVSITTPLITSHGELLRDSQRAYIKKAFHGEVFNRYGLEETGDVAVECFRHEGLHIQENKIIVEILDDNGIPLPDGKQGRIVVTDMTNRVGPFIRYDTGDTGYIFPKKCECGIAFKKIQVLGRKYGGFFTLAGKKYHIGELEVFMTKLNYPILRYQIAQEHDSVEIKIVPSRPLRRDEVIGIQTECALAFGFLASIRVVEAIPFAESGKTPFIANNKDIGA